MNAREQILGRLYLVLILLAALPVMIAAQLAWVHIGRGDALREEGFRQARSQVLIAAERGEILDVQGRALVVNTPRYNLALDPTIPGFEEDAFVKRLAAFTGVSERALTRAIARRSSRQYVQLVELTPEQRAEVESWNVPGVILDEQFRRRYNYGTTASHVLGHVDVDGVGKAGIELEYDQYLQGRPGRRPLQRDRRGYRRVDAEGAVVPPEDGETIVLTIDLIRQTILEEELVAGVRRARAKRGSAVAVDPRSGAILAMANVPSFDPNTPVDAPVYAWRNAAITDRLEPGSSFKLVAASAALETGTVALQDTIDTGNGRLVIYGRTMHDTHVYGAIPFTDVIVKSSNVGMALTAQQLTPGLLYRYARDYGFGRKTWIDLPGEVNGFLKRTSRWSKTTLTSMSIGYEVDITPLQILMAYAALADGGLLRQPYIVAERRDVTGRVLWSAADDPARTDSIRRVVDEETAQALLPALIEVVNRGTARQAQVEGLLIAGKTGTARKVVNGQYGSGYRATFVGFYPADDPQVAMAVVLDEPRTSIYGGAVAGPIFKRVAERWMGTLPVITAPPPPPVPEPAPEPLYERAERALENVANALRPLPDSLRMPIVLIRETSAVTQVSSAVKAVTPVDPPAHVPDLRGLGARAALFRLASMGMHGVLEGEGRVVDQTPAPGEPYSNPITLRLE